MWYQVNGSETRTYEIDLLRDTKMFYVVSQVCLPISFLCLAREWGQFGFEYYMTSYELNGPIQDKYM